MPRAAPLLQAYSCLAALEGTANLAQHTLDDANDVLNQQELQKLGMYFGRVRGREHSRTLTRLCHLR